MTALSVLDCAFAAAFLAGMFAGWVVRRIYRETRLEEGSGRPGSVSGSPVHAGSEDARGSSGSASSLAANSARTREDCPWCASEREQGRRLAALVTDQRVALHAILEYAEECKARRGALLGAETVAAALFSLLAGLNLSPRPCEACVARRETLHRHAALITGLADMQRVEAGE